MGKNKQGNTTGQNDWIHICGLQLKCRIGVSPRERQRKQTITVDIALKCDLRRAGQSDRLKDTIDYSTVVKAVTAMAAKEIFSLLEAMAERIANICLANLRVTEVIVKVSKRGVLPNISSADVEIHRTRSD